MVDSANRPSGIDELGSGSLPVSAETVDGALANVSNEIGGRLNNASELAPVYLETTFDPEHPEALISMLRYHFECHPRLHGKISWDNVERALRSHPEVMQVLHNMEATGGEVDVIGETELRYLYGDCSDESPEDRRFITHENAVEMAKQYGARLMSEAEYRALQIRHSVDVHSRSRLETDPKEFDDGDVKYGTRMRDFIEVAQGEASEQADDLGCRVVVSLPKTE